MFAVINLPLGYYSGFVLPHRFDQSNQSLKDWVVDQLKGLAIGAPLGLLMLELLYLALRLTGDAWWLWVAGGLLLFNVILSNLAPVLIMPLFNKYVPLGDEHKELEERLLDLAKRANTKVKGVFKFDMSKRTKAANAALTGLGNTRRIILGDTLINEFTLDEIETVLAHELGHHVHKDIPFLIAFGTLSTTLSLFIASLALDSAVSFFSFTSAADIAAFPALMLILSAYGLLTSPLDNAISRWRENMADDYALSIHRQERSLCLRIYTFGKSKPRGDRPREMGGLHVLFASALGRTNRKSQKIHSHINKKGLAITQVLFTSHLLLITSLTPPNHSSTPSAQPPRRQWRDPYARPMQARCAPNPFWRYLIFPLSQRQAHLLFQQSDHGSW